MKRLVKVTINAVIDVEDENEVEEVINDIVHFADWEFDSFEWQDFGEVED